MEMCHYPHSVRESSARKTCAGKNAKFTALMHSRLIVRTFTYVQSDIIKQRYLSTLQLFGIYLGAKDLLLLIHKLEPTIYVISRH